MKKILAAIVALALIMPVAAEAGTNRHKKPGGHNNYHSGQNYHKKHKNYYHGHKNNNHNNNFYNDPNFWWGAGAGLLGGAIINEYRYNNYPPPGYYVQGVQCQIWDSYSNQYVWAQGEICYR